MENNFVFYANLLDMDECASDPCQNNATCVDLINEFRCDCVPGFNGTLCGNSKTNCFITYYCQISDSLFKIV